MREKRKIGLFIIEIFEYEELEEKMINAKKNRNSLKSNNWSI